MLWKEILRIKLKIYLLKIISKLSKKKVKLEKDAEIFYKVHETKPFYDALCNYLSSGPVLVMVLKKKRSCGQ